MSLSATVHGHYTVGALSATNFVPDKIVIKYFLPLDPFRESSGIPALALQALINSLFRGDDGYISDH